MKISQRSFRLWIQILFSLLSVDSVYGNHHSLPPSRRGGYLSLRTRAPPSLTSSHPHVTTTTIASYSSVFVVTEVATTAFTLVVSTTGEGIGA
ncbi:hypothetical protein HA466_0032950 [Hirschfeldia incana]|nr:hypothetical protein HA466_0032950 [Hirschfeldia incana]